MESEKREKKKCIFNDQRWNTEGKRVVKKGKKKKSNEDKEGTIKKSNEAKWEKKTKNKN